MSDWFSTRRWTAGVAGGFAIAALAATLLLRRQAPPPGPNPAPQVAAREKAAPARSEECSCPLLPRQASDKEPAKGVVDGEINDDDLRAVFSNRVDRFAGSWDEAFAEILSEAGETAGPGAPKRAKPRVGYPDIALEEGGLAKLVASGTQLSAGSGGSASPWLYTVDPPSLMDGLLATIARTWRHGEPSLSLRKHAIRATRFLAADLAVFPPHTSAHADRVRALGFQSRSQLWSVISAASPSAMALEAQGGGSPNIRQSSPERLPLDAFDMADAALAVLDLDDDGSSRTMAVAYEEDAVQAVGALAELAAARRIFGGKAEPGSKLDAVACRAFAVLVRLADPAVPRSELLRAELRRIWDENVVVMASPEARPEVMAVARAAQIRVGFGPGEEATKTAESLLARAVISVDHKIEGALDETLDLVTALETGAGDERPANREAFALRWIKSVRELEERQSLGTGGEAEAGVLKALAVKSVFPPLNVAAAGASCEEVSCGAEMLKESGGVPPDSAYEAHPGVRVTAAPRVGMDGSLRDTLTVDALLKDEPLIVELTASATLAGTLRGPASVEVANQRSGAKASMALERRKQDGKAVVFANGTPFALPFATQNGDVVRVSYDSESGTEVTIYDDEIQRTIGRARHNLELLLILYESTAEDLRAVQDRPAQALPAATVVEKMKRTVEEARRKALAAASLPAIEKRLQVIANARVFLDYQSRSEDKFVYTDLTRAVIASNYMELLQRAPGEWDSSPGSCTERSVRGPDPRFPGVRYVACEEGNRVALALDETADRARATVLATAKKFAIDSYRLAVAASCMEMMEAGAPVCPADFWVIVVGIDETGAPVSKTARVTAGIGIAAPYVLDAVGALRNFAVRQFAKRAAARAEGVAQAERAILSRRSAILRGSAQETSIGAHVDFASVQLPTNERVTLPGARIDYPAGFVPKLTPQGRWTTPGGFLVQVSDDTCQMTVAEWMRRQAGKLPRDEMTNLTLAFERGRYLKGGIYTPGEGTKFDGFGMFMQQEGAAVHVPSAATTIADIEKAIAGGTMVSATVNVAAPGSTELFYHAVVVTGVHHTPRGSYVRYGDPWNGNFWLVDACTFKQRMDPYRIAFVKW